MHIFIYFLKQPHNKFLSAEGGSHIFNTHFKLTKLSD